MLIANPMPNLGLLRAAWALLIYNLFVIVFGAFVRATGSGAGCGSHWPLCNGQVIPRAPELETIIEFTHRATSGLVLLAVIWIVWAVRKRFPKGHPTRTYAWASLWLTVVEALIGAGLVLYELVDQDKSNARLVSITLHLVNTFLLLGALTLFTRSLRSPERVDLRTAKTPTQRLWLLAGVLLLATGTTGAIAALGNTLYPAESLTHGIQQDFHPESHLALRVRILHPVFAVASALLIFALGARRISSTAQSTPARMLIAVTAGNVGLGLLNLLLLAPVWMQLVHLFVADLVWIAWIWSFADLKASEPALEPGLKTAVDPA